MTTNQISAQPIEKQVEEEDQTYPQNDQEKVTPMNALTLIIVGLLIAGVAAYFGLKRLITRTENSNLNHVESTIRSAVAEAAARRLHTNVDEIQRTLAGEDLSSGLSHRLRSEFLECRVSFSPPEKNLVLMTILIHWRDSQVTKVEQKQNWEMLPENVRAALIRTQHPYEYSWPLPALGN